jgi:uncharacterized NAD(P)/FAD-binding protein YdhS
MKQSPSVAVIGAGASGLLTTIQLLTQGGKSGPRVYLIEKSSGFGTGAAYSTNDPSHILNTRAGNMSAFPDRPNHFLEWLSASLGESTTPFCFVSRQTYGRYLRSLLRDAAQTAGAAGRLYLVADEAVSLRPIQDGGFSVRLGVGREIQADAVILATGNPAPFPPVVDDDGVLNSPSYVDNPWLPEATAAVPRERPVLLLGTGLTMVDVAIALANRGHEGTIIALSRRGLLPRSHTPLAGARKTGVPAFEARLLHDLRSLRRHIDEEVRKGADWRDIIDALRPHTQHYWQSLPLWEKRRFLRHLRPWWDVHRHRLAPAIHDRLHALIAAGRLKIVKGRVKSFKALDDGFVSVTWTPRASSSQEQLLVARIINCMGPGFGPAKEASPILRQLLQNGLAVEDDLALGLRVDGASHILDASEKPHAAMFAIGPVTRGTFWEVTAVPDIRVKAAEVAAECLMTLQMRGLMARACIASQS